MTFRIESRAVQNLAVGDEIASRGTVTAIDENGPHGLWRVEIAHPQGTGWFPWPPERDVTVVVER